MLRRQFLGSVAGVAAGVAVSPRSLLSESVATERVAPLDLLHTRVSPTSYPGESVGLWGELPSGRIVAKAIAPAWRERTATTREIVFEGSSTSAFAPYPFEELRPFRVIFPPSTKLPELWVNRPRVDWVEHEVVYPGQRLRLFGRSLHCANTATLRSSGSNPVFLETLRSAPYVFEARVPNCAPGQYDLLVDGVRIDGLKVVSRGADPLALEVAWASKFAWDKVVELASEKAPADRTAAIQAALDAAGQNGGGVVQLAAGEFGIKHLTVPAHVVLMGSGPGLTVLRYLGGEAGLPTRDAPSIYQHGRIVTWEGAHPIIEMKAGPAGLARLSILSDIMQPDDGHRRIEGYVKGLHVDARQDSFFFVSDVEMRFVSGMGIEASVASDMIVQRCSVTVPCEGIHVSAFKASGRVTVRDCTATNQQRPVAVLNASCSVFEGNHLIGQNKLIPWCNGEHRIMDLGPAPVAGSCTHHYIADNAAEGIFGTPNENDGEGLNYQQCTRLAYAAVGSADARTITDPTAAFATDTLKGATLIVVKGKGLGQVRTVVEHTATILTVEPKWDVVPDATSAYTVDKVISAWGCIIVNNRLSGVKKRAVDLYCKNYDNWIQGNLIVNAGGVFLNATENIQQKRLDMAYFNVVRDNVIMGSPTDPATGLPQQKLIGTDHGLGWGVRVGNVAKSQAKAQMPGVSVYGNEIRNNTIYGPMTDSRAAGIVIGVDTVAASPSALGNVIEGNELHDMPVGIRVGAHVEDTYMKGNRFFLKGANTQEFERGGAF